MADDGRRAPSNVDSTHTVSIAAQGEELSRPTRIDIAHRQQAETRLGQREEHLRLALQAADMGWWDWDVEADVLLADDRAKALFGLPPAADPSFELLLELTHPEDRAVVHQRLQDSLDAPGEYEVEIRTVWRDGSIHWVSLRGRAFHDDQGKPLRLMGIAMDNTRRRQTEEQLRQRAEEVERLLEVVPVPMWVAHDPRCQNITGNHAANEIHRVADKVNVSPAPSPGWTAPNVRYYRCGKELAAEELPMQVAVAQAGDVRDAEIEIAHADGTRQVLLGNASPLLDPEGKVRGAVGAFVDITAHKRAEGELKALNETLEHRVAQRTAELEQRASQLRALASELAQTGERERQDLARVLHDQLQQLLVAARMKVGLLRRGLHDMALVRGLQEVDQLLHQSIAESRSLTLELSPPALHDGGLAVGLEWLGRQMEEKYGLFVEVQACDDANPADDATRVFLFQAARELLFNVVKHAEADRAVVRLRTMGFQEIQIEVSDNGVGCDPVRLEQPARSGGGFGLFSVRERLRLLDARLEVETAPGQGTRVMIMVPNSDSALAKENPSSPPAAEVTPFVSTCSSVSPVLLGKLRVLLVDDHPIVRDRLADLLRAQPEIAEVVEARDGQQAVELALETSPDVVVMDVAMPRLNGIEATRRIKARLPRTRIIALSMYDEADMAATMAEAGATRYLRKDVSSEDLLGAILS